MKILIASQNKGKLKEFRNILEPFGYDVLAANDAGYNLDHVIEDGLTFEDNALIKARELHRMSGLPVIADDSGLCIDALPEILGVYSARFMGYETPYDVRIQEILKLLEGKDNKASFHSVIAYVSDQDEQTFAGSIDGFIHSPNGLGGFGYDPIFYPVGYEASFSAMDEQLKNEISHRGIALRGFVEYIKGLK